jgi:hypothetical protein
MFPVRPAELGNAGAEKRRREKLSIRGKSFTHPGWLLTGAVLS